MADNDSKILEQIREVISQIAPLVDREEDGCFDIHGWSGGNLDDAYSLGETDGEASLAERIRKLLSDTNS